MLKTIGQLFCAHEDIKKWRAVDGRPGITNLYVECIKCGRETNGVETGKLLRELPNH